VADEREWLAARFDELRPRLRSVAYSVLGSMSEADDAVQECWVRLDRSDASRVEDLQAWLTTVVGRICLDMLRRRRSRREDYLGDWLPDPVVEMDGSDPEEAAMLADSVGLALLVVLETLSPPERLAFVLHDVFGVPFDEVGRVVDRTPQAARQLATRARRRVRSAPTPDADLARQRVVVDAFLTAARSGDMSALLTVLDPAVVFRFDTGVAVSRTLPVVGAQAVAERVLESAPRFASYATPAIVNGNAGVMVLRERRLMAVIGFTVVNERIVGIDLVANQEKLRHILRP